MTRQRVHYSLDVIIAVGYRINTKRGTQFRQCATQGLENYLVQGYAINEKHLERNQLKVQTLKDGVRILNRAMKKNRRYS